MKKKTSQNQGSKINDWVYRTETSDGQYTYTLKAEAKEVLLSWGRKGLTKEEISKNMGISRSTLDAWIKKCPDISDAIKNARAYACARVENALFKKAVGYTYPTQEAVKLRTVEYNNGKRVKEEEEVVFVTKTVVVPPDLGAIIFFLTNREPKEWVNKRPFTANDETVKDNNALLWLNELGSSIAANLKKPDDEIKKETSEQTP